LCQTPPLIKYFRHFDIDFKRKIRLRCLGISICPDISFNLASLNVSFPVLEENKHACNKE
jgi:hypothetical protein